LLGADQKGQGCSDRTGAVMIAKSMSLKERHITRRLVIKEDPLKLSFAGKKKLDCNCVTQMPMFYRNWNVGDNRTEAEFDL
jgi:hypothetical protein